MRVITVCVADWCNVGFGVAKALRAAGVANAESFKTAKHNFGYAEESRVVSKETMREEIRNADIVFIMNSNYFCLELCKELKKERVYVYHTGTTYRRKPAQHNADFNPYIVRAFTDQTEFIGTGMKDENYTFSAIDTEQINCPILLPEKKIRIAHYPSNPVVKGTSIIRQTLERLDREMRFLNLFEWIIDENVVSNPKQLERMSQCDVYVELFAPLHEGNPYGCFGVTAMEAAALGKIVVTNHTTPEVYEKYYGVPTPFITPQTEDGLYAMLKHLILSDRTALFEKKKYTRDWVEVLHSIPATGRRFKELMNIP